MRTVRCVAMTREKRPRCHTRTEGDRSGQGRLWRPCASCHGGCGVEGLGKMMENKANVPRRCLVTEMLKNFCHANGVWNDTLGRAKVS